MVYKITYKFKSLQGKAMSGAMYKDATTAAKALRWAKKTHQVYPPEPKSRWGYKVNKISQPRRLR